MIKDFLKDYLAHLRLFSPNARKFLIGSFFMGLGLSVFQLLMNLYLVQLGFDEGHIGSIISASSIGTVLIAIPAAILVDRFRIKYILMFATLTSGSALITQALSTSIWNLRIMSMISGSMFTIHMIAASPFFMRNSTSAERPYLFGVNMAVSTFSGFIGSIIGGLTPIWLVETGATLLLGYRYTLVGGALTAMLSLAAYSAIKAKTTDSGQSLKPRNYMGARDWKTTLKLMIPHFLIGMGAGLVIPFLNLYFLKRFELESDDIGRIFSFGALFTAAGFLAGPAIARRVGLVKTVVISQFLSIPFFLVLAFSHNLFLSVVAFLFRGSLMNMAWPMYNNFAMEMGDEKNQASVNSALSLAWNSSWMISANIGGLMIEKSGFTAVMLATVGLYLASTTASWLLFNKYRTIGIGLYPAAPGRKNNL